MSNQFDCPGCYAPLAYSAALRGRTVRCHHCGHSFPVADLLEPVAVTVPALIAEAALESPLVPPPLPRALIPPPLPVRTSRNRPILSPTELAAATIADEPHSPDFVDETAADGDMPLDLAPSEAKERPSKVGPVVGVVGVLLFSLFVLASGIGYLIWPGSSRPTAPTIPAAAPPVETPVDVEQPKSLREVLEGSGPEPPPPAAPGAPKFNPGPPGKAPIPGPKFQRPK